MVALNNETAILIAIGLAVFILMLVFSFSSNVIGEAKDSILGGNDEPGIIDCDASTGKNCPGNTQESSFSIQRRKYIEI